MFTIMVLVIFAPTSLNQSDEKSENPVYEPIILRGKPCSSNFAPIIKSIIPVLTNWTINNALDINRNYSDLESTPI